VVDHTARCEYVFFKSRLGGLGFSFLPNFSLCLVDWCQNNCGFAPGVQSAVKRTHRAGISAVYG